MKNYSDNNLETENKDAIIEELLQSNIDKKIDIKMDNNKLYHTDFNNDSIIEENIELKSIIKSFIIKKLIIQ